MLHDNNNITFTYLFYTRCCIYTYEKLYEIKQAPVLRGFSYARIAFDPGLYTFIWRLSFTGLHGAFTRLYGYVFNLDHGRYNSIKNPGRVLRPFTAPYSDFAPYPYKV